ncbi:MAG TPA: HAD family hydrolase [Streptosporangiaceae bacterium]|nr:HAD family hydrolase [Streptosporangiaceae bacterium]
MSSSAHISMVCCELVGTMIGDGSGQESLIERAFSEALATQGVVPGTSAYARSMAEVSRARGRSALDVLGNLFPDNQARAQAASLAFDRACHTALDRGMLTAQPGAEQAMDKITGSGIRLCLISSLSRRMLQAMLDMLGWRKRADLALCPDDAPRGFPWPDLVLTAMLRLGTGDVREVAMASGTENGVIAGCRAGAGIVAGVLTGPHTPARLRRAGATHLVESVADLPDLVVATG